MAEAPHVAHSLKHTLVVPSASWIAYDTANTIYSAVLTFMFFPYVGELFNTRGMQGAVNSASMIVTGLCVPVFASLADYTARSRLYLILCTMTCIVALSLFGVTTSAFVMMAMFFIANIGYNAALVFYNSLLPSVAADRQQGLISGLGVGFGYIGTILIVFLIDLPEKYQALLGLDEPAAYAATFASSAALFFVLALPCFIFVHERRVKSSASFSWGLVKKQFVSVWRTVKGLPKDRAMMWFLLGNFFCVDVLNTAIAFFGDFTKNTFLPNGAPRGDLSVPFMTITKASQLLVVSGMTLNILALLFGLLLGFLTDKLGALRVMRTCALFLVVGLIGSAIFGGSNLLLFLIAICGFGGMGLAGIWTAGRKLLIDLSPRERIGEYMGLYGITNKLSVLGSAIFGILFDVVNHVSGDDLLAWKVALGTQAIPLAMGLFCLWRVHISRRRLHHAAHLSTT